MEDGFSATAKPRIQRQGISPRGATAKDVSAQHNEKGPNNVQDVPSQHQKRRHYAL